MGKIANGFYISIKAFRKQHNLKQKEMASKLEISREHYSRLETGKLNPPKKLLLKINDLIGSQSFSLEDCKTTELEICSLCRQLKENDRDAIKMKIKKIIKSYNIQSLIISLVFNLIFNSDLW